jgi:predicted  nucleic acid-binding Zn-ribbon protein
MEELRHLYQLQQLDIQIDDLGKTLADVESKLADNSILLDARNRLATVEAHSEKLAAGRRASDRTIADLQVRLEQIQARLYSGSITSVKEMEATEEERATTEKSLADTEDRLLEIMVRAEEVEETLTKGLRVVERLEAQRNADVDAMTSQVEGLKANIEVLTVDRGELREATPGPTLHQYETLRANKGGMAVAKVDRGMCSGCRVTLSTSELQRVRLATKPMRCSSCRRIMYLP